MIVRSVPTPSNDRTWVEPQSRAARAYVSGDEVTIRHVRDFRYGPDGAIVRAHWEDRRYDLRTLESAWLGLSPFGSIPGVAHVFVSFGFADGRYLAVSIEARREQGEKYSPFLGVLRAYELIYVIGDERDVVGLRTHVYGDPVYLYPIRTVPDDLRATFLDILARADALAAEPEFYDTIVNSCSVNLARHVNRVLPGKVPASPKLVLAAYSDALAHDVGLLDVDGPFESVRERYRINARAAGDLDAHDFSQRIRAVPDD